MESVDTFDAGYLLAGLAAVAVLCWVVIARSDDDGGEPHDDWDEFEPRRHDPEDVARLTVF